MVLIGGMTCTSDNGKLFRLVWRLQRDQGEANLTPSYVSQLITQLLQTDSNNFPNEQRKNFRRLLQTLLPNGPPPVLGSQRRRLNLHRKNF